MIGLYITVLCLGAVCLSASPATGSCPGIISRQEWGAKPPGKQNNISEPTPYVALHHTYIPGPCNTTEACKNTMKNIQSAHQDQMKWGDIGYSFCIGGDGNIYEGRGWGIEGAHTLGWNKHSIGVCLIGDFRTVLPSKTMLQQIDKLAKCGVSKGHLHKNFKYFGHLQVSKTECPGKAFYDYIQKMPEWIEKPSK